MIYKEEASLKLRNPRVFNDFKSVTPRMRAILLDWLMEVAAVYHLRRVTYYLSVDYFDRFLSIRPDIPKSLLQLVGITCLYIAAKVEEIYPPNLSEFSYVCDGACKSKEIVSCELLILNSLGWEVVSTTPSDWLNLYMQLHFKSSDIVRTALNMDFNKDFIFPQYSAYQFTRASQLMDLLSLDPGFLKFGYSVIAAAAMYFMYGKEIALSVSGLAWEQLKSCVDYMEVFYTIIKDVPDPRLHSCLGGPHPEEMNRFSTGLMERVQSGPQNENYSFQTHVASMDYFEKATIYRLTRQKSQTQATEKHLESTAINDNLKSNTTDFCTVKSIVGNDDNECTDGIEDNENSIPADKCIGSNLIDNITPLEELTKNDDSHDVEASNSEQNLMSLDEIFELILSQDELKNTNSE
jgi:cyclin E